MENKNHRGRQAREAGRCVTLISSDWLRVGYELWNSYGHMERDYFVMCTDHQFEVPQRKFADPERVASFFRHALSVLEIPFCGRNGRWVGRKESTLLEGTALLYFSGHSPRHWLPSVSAALGVPKEKRDYVGRWHVNLHQSQDYVLTSRQIVHEVQELVCNSICRGTPGFCETEMLEDFSEYLRGKEVPDDEVKQVIASHEVVKKNVNDDGVESWNLQRDWPGLELLWQSGGEHAMRSEHDHEGVDQPDTDQAPIEDEQAPFFVTISRRSGFRRLHRRGYCGVFHGTCQQVEFLRRVDSAAADAFCKICLKKGGLRETSNLESSTSGSSSSTSDEEAAQADAVNDDMH